MDAYRIFLLRRGLEAFIGSFISIVMVVFYVRTVGLNPLQLVLVGTALEVAAFFFEVPTGVVADTYSRKWSLVISYLLRGLCYLLQGLFPFFGIILVASFINGIGYTFASGAEDAWLADEIGAEQVGRAQLRGSQVGSGVGFLGMVAGIIVASNDLALPMSLGGVAMLGLALFSIVAMPERGFKPIPRGERSMGQHLGGTFTEGLKLVRGSRILLLIIAIAFVYGGFSEGFDRLWRAHFITDIGFPALGSGSTITLGSLVLDTQLVWFGLISTGSIILGLTIIEWLRRRVDTNSHVAVTRTLLISNALLIVAVVCFGLAGNFLFALAMVWAIGVIRDIKDPLTTTWIVQHSQPQVRATVISMWSQADALGQMTAGPAVGWLATAAGMGPGIAVSGFILAPALWLYARALRHRQAAAKVADELVIVAE